ncbi:hypothetical protein HDE_07535 [Halotydeus destructor]|nr:hypothetical protein HDE_07535 [Halotydeus destructor]
MGSCYSSHPSKGTSLPSSRPNSKKPNLSSIKGRRRRKRNNSFSPSQKSSNREENKNKLLSNGHYVETNHHHRRQVEDEQQRKAKSGSAIINCAEGVSQNFAGQANMSTGNPCSSALPTASDVAKKRSMLPRFGASKIAPVKSYREGVNTSEPNPVRPTEAPKSGLLVPKRILSNTSVGRLKPSVVGTANSSSTSSMSSGFSQSSVSTKSSGSTTTLKASRLLGPLNGTPVNKKSPIAHPNMAPQPTMQSRPQGKNIQAANQNIVASYNLRTRVESNKNMKSESSDARNGNYVSQPAMLAVASDALDADGKGRRIGCLSQLPAPKHTQSNNGVGGAHKSVPSSSQFGLKPHNNRSSEYLSSHHSQARPPIQRTSHGVSSQPSLHSSLSANVPVYRYQSLPTTQHQQQPPSTSTAQCIPAVRPPLYRAANNITYVAKETCPYRRPIGNPSLLSATSSQPNKSIGQRPSSLDNAPSSLDKPQPHDTGLKLSTTVNRAVNAADSTTMYATSNAHKSHTSGLRDRALFDANCNPVTLKATAGPIKLTNIRRPIIEPKSSFVNNPPVVSTAVTSAVKEYEKSLNDLRNTEQREYGKEASMSSSVSSDNSTPVMTSPAKSLPRLGSAGSSTGTDVDRDFLIDDEISDQPDLMVISHSIDDSMSERTLERSLCELEDLKAKQNSIMSPESLSRSSSINSSLSRSTSNGAAKSSTTKFTKPRALSLVESPEGNLGFDGTSYRSLMQDMHGVKLLLFRLQGLLQNVETTNPFDHQTNSFKNLTDDKGYTSDGFEVDPSLSLKQENCDLKLQLALLQQQLEDKDKTIKLLQNQMTKYLNIDSANSVREEQSSSATQTERNYHSCSESQGMSARDLSTNPNGMLVRQVKSNHEDVDYEKRKAIEGESEC